MIRAFGRRAHSKKRTTLGVLCATLASASLLCDGAIAAAQAAATTSTTTTASPREGAVAAVELTKPAPGPLRGMWELRPVIGMTGNLAGLKLPQPGQQSPPLIGAMQLGVDVFRHLGGGTAFMFGAWGSTDEGFIGAEVHLGVKHRFFGINPVVVPTVLGGIGFQWGLPRAGNDRRTVTGLGVRAGFGLDFQATPRVYPGIQFVLDIGPRFLPNVSLLATTQVVVGVGFVL